MTSHRTGQRAGAAAAADAPAAPTAAALVRAVPDGRAADPGARAGAADPAGPADHRVAAGLRPRPDPRRPADRVGRPGQLHRRARPPASSGRRCGSPCSSSRRRWRSPSVLGLLLAHLLLKVSGWVRVIMLLSMVTGVGDAADHRDADLAVADRPAVRRAQLRAQQDRRAADPHVQLVRRTADRLDGDHRHRRLGCPAVRGDQPARRADRRLDRPHRGRPAGRCRRLEGVHRGHPAGDQADPDDHHHAVDHLGLPGVRADLAAAGHRRQQGLLLHDRHLVVRGVLLQQELRARRGHRADQCGAARASMSALRRAARPALRSPRTERDDDGPDHGRRGPRQCTTDSPPDGLPTAERPVRHRSPPAPPAPAGDQDPVEPRRSGGRGGDDLPGLLDGLQLVQDRGQPAPGRPAMVPEPVHLRLLQPRAGPAAVPDQPAATA